MITCHALTLPVARDFLLAADKIALATHGNNVAEGHDIDAQPVDKAQSAVHRQTREEAQIGPYCQAMGAEPAQLLREPVLRRHSGTQQVFARVAKRPQLVTLAAQLGHFGTQPDHFDLRLAVEASDVLAVPNAPQRDRGPKPDAPRHHDTAQRPVQAAAHDRARRTSEKTTMPRTPAHGDRNCR